MKALLVILMCAGIILAACGELQAKSTTGETLLNTEAAAPTGPPAECADDSRQRKCAVFAPGEPIKIGYAGPLTGDFSALGTDYYQAGMIAIKEAGEYLGHAYELDAKDSRGADGGGTSAANQFTSDPHIVAIAGHTFSNSAGASIPIYNLARVPMLSATAPLALLTKKGNQDVFNRIAFTDEIQGTTVAEYLHDELDFNRIVVIHDGSTYGHGLAQSVRSAYTELGGEVVTFEAITPGEADYSSVLESISDKQPQAIFYGGYDTEAAVIKKQMDLAGLEGVVFFTDDRGFGTNYLKLTGANAEGSYATAAVPPTSAAKDKFDAAYLEAYGTPAGSLSSSTWICYDSVAALISVIEKTAIEGSDGNLYIPREALVKNVRNLSGFQALTGVITCSSNGECNTAGPTIFIVRDGEWVEVSKTAVSGN